MEKLPKKPLRNDLTIKEINETGQRIKNWGRWGPDDEIGTLNFVTPECITAARDTIRDGKVCWRRPKTEPLGVQHNSWTGFS